MAKCLVKQGNNLYIVKINNQSYLVEANVWPTPIASCDFSDADCPDVDINDVMSGNMYGDARLTQLSGGAAQIDLYDCFTGNRTWYCAQLVTSGNNPYNYPHCTGIIGFDENLECCDFDSLEGGSGNAYSDGTDDTRYIVIYSVSTGTATDCAYNYGKGPGETPNIIDLLNAMISDPDIDHLLMFNINEEKLYLYK